MVGWLRIYLYIVIGLWKKCDNWQSLRCVMSISALISPNEMTRERMKPRQSTQFEWNQMNGKKILRDDIFVCVHRAVDSVFHCAVRALSFAFFIVPITALVHILCHTDGI